jgi:hypothetical protein
VQRIGNLLQDILGHRCLCHTDEREREREREPRFLLSNIQDTTFHLPETRGCSSSTVRPVDLHLARRTVRPSLCGQNAATRGKSSSCPLPTAVCLFVCLFIRADGIMRSQRTDSPLFVRTSYAFPTRNHYNTGLHIHKRPSNDVLLASCAKVGLCDLHAMYVCESSITPSYQSAYMRRPPFGTRQRFSNNFLSQKNAKRHSSQSPP